MQFTRIMALVQRSMKLTYRGIDPLIDIFYWPLLDIVVWGFAGTWVSLTAHKSVSFIWLINIVIWQACVRVNFDVSLNLLVELWSRNMVNLFATPVQISEWMVAAMVTGLIDALLVVFYGAALVAVLYKVNIFSIGWLFIPLLILVILPGWAVGFFSAGLLITGGQKIQKLVWVLAWFFAPFSALFYPMSAVPKWVAFIAKFVPMSYVFEGLRTYATSGSFPLYNLAMSLLLSCLYLTLSLIFFIRMFHKSRAEGLARLEAE